MNYSKYFGKKSFVTSTSSVLTSSFKPVQSFVNVGFTVNLWIHGFYRELKQGISLTDKDGGRIGESAIAAQKAIAQVTFSRIGMAVPSMGMC